VGPEAEPEIAARVPPRDQTGSVQWLLEHRIVHQGGVQELGRFIVGEGIAIEVVGRIELPKKEVEAVIDKMKSKAGFPDRQLFVLPTQRLRIRVHTGKTPEPPVGPRATDGLEIDEQRRPRHRPGEKYQIDCPLAEEPVFPFPGVDDLLEGGARRTAHGDFLGLRFLEGRFDFLGDGLAPRERFLPDRLTDLRPTP
jgi:hypothetical protein